MCSLCFRSPCVIGCPNADDPKTVWKCKYCGEPITVGDEYVEFDDDYYHESCFSDAAESILFDLGARKGIADEYDMDDGTDDAVDAMIEARVFGD